MSVLHTHAELPIALRPPPPAEEVVRAEAATAPWPTQLVEFYTLHDGQSDASHDWAGELLPMSSLFSLSRIVHAHQMMMEINEITMANDPELPFADAREAGSQAGIFLPSYVPFCGNDGHFYYCDTRPGEHYGCVRRWERDYCDEPGPEWASVEHMLMAIRTSVLNDEPVDRIWLPHFEDGKLTWDPAD